jgi:ubiquinone/menaquinone biosynthesis C-methylase UbiE
MMASGAQRMTSVKEGKPASATSGIVLHSPAFYDFIVWLLMRGKEREFRERVLNLALLAAGESVLDVGCGTGTLAIAAKQHVGSTGKVYGLDASQEMLTRAEKKARKAGVEVAFSNGIVEQMPFPDAQFDAVLSTVMLHHLPQKPRSQCVREMCRVAKPGGRVLVVDFGGSDQNDGLISRIHRGHGHVTLQDLTKLVTDAGLTVADSGAVGFRNMNFVLAKLPCCA